MKTRSDEKIAAFMREKQTRVIWYGDPDLVMDCGNLCGFSGHPLNISASVIRIVARSKLFVYCGFIRHLGRKYNCYELIYFPKENNETEN